MLSKHFIYFLTFVFQKEASKSGNLKATFMAEEKIKKLKKRNTELVSIARQLEDKAKKLQEEKATAQVCTDGIPNYSWFILLLKIVLYIMYHSSFVYY